MLFNCWLPGGLAADLGPRGRRTITVDVRGFFLAVRNRWWVVILATVIGAAAAVGITSREAKQYSSSVTFFVATPSAEPGQAYQANLYAQALVNSYVKLLSSDELARRVIALAGLHATPHAVAAKDQRHGRPEYGAADRERHRLHPGWCGPAVVGGRHGVRPDGQLPEQQLRHDRRQVPRSGVRRVRADKPGQGGATAHAQLPARHSGWPRGGPRVGHAARTARHVRPLRRAGGRRRHRRARVGQQGPAPLAAAAHRRRPRPFHPRRGDAPAPDKPAVHADGSGAR